MKLKSKLQKLMQDRYGADELYIFLLYIYFFLFIINIYIKSSVIEVLNLLIIIIILIRFFSKNINKRKMENKLYLKFKTNILNKTKTLKKHYNEKDVYVYKKCRSCKTTLRLPLPEKCGFQHVKCPKCKNKFTFFCLRREKVEIIKKK